MPTTTPIPDPARADLRAEHARLVKRLRRTSDPQQQAEIRRKINLNEKTQSDQLQTWLEGEIASLVPGDDAPRAA